jgi:hypothetical protein
MGPCAAAIAARLGFGALGPMAGMPVPALRNHCHATNLTRLGTAAAAWQAAIGVVSAGTLFALLQAIGMGAALHPAVAVVFGIVVAIWWFLSHSEDGQRWKEKILDSLQTTAQRAMSVVSRVGRAINSGFKSLFTRLF